MLVDEYFMLAHQQGHLDVSEYLGPQKGVQRVLI